MSFWCYRKWRKSLLIWPRKGLNGINPIKRSIFLPRSFKCVLWLTLVSHYLNRRQGSNPSRFPIDENYARTFRRIGSSVYWSDGCNHNTHKLNLMMFQVHQAAFWFNNWCSCTFFSPFPQSGTCSNFHPFWDWIHWETLKQLQSTCTGTKVTLEQFKRELPISLVLEELSICNIISIKFSTEENSCYSRMIKNVQFSYRARPFWVNHVVPWWRFVLSWRHYTRCKN